MDVREIRAYKFKTSLSCCTYIANRNLNGNWKNLHCTSFLFKNDLNSKYKYKYSCNGTKVNSCSFPSSILSQ